MWCRRSDVLTASLAALAIAGLASCGDDCDSVPCRCQGELNPLYETGWSVHDTVAARDAFLDYADAALRDPDILPGFVLLAAPDSLRDQPPTIGYIRSSRSFRSNGLQYWQILISYDLHGFGGWYHDLRVSEKGTIVEIVPCT